MTLDEVFAAAAARAASLAPETSGYLALAVGDATSRLPLLHDDRTLLLTTEGSMSTSRRGDVVAPERAAKAMRDVLARLLAVSSGTMPGLAAAARPREESARGVDAVIEEIEAALIPVNRAAARRALARLSRETLRAKEAGKLKPRREVSARPPPPPAPVAVAVAVAAPAPAPVVAAVVVERGPSAQAVFSEPPPLAPRVEAVVPDMKLPVLDAPAAVLAAPPVDLEAKIAELDAHSVELDAQIAKLDEHYADLDASFVDADPSVAVPEVQPPVPEAEPELPGVQPDVPEVQPTSDEAVTVVPEEQIVVAYVEPVVETPLPLPSPQAPRFALKGFAEQTPTTLGMAIEIDEAETPFASMALMHATVLGAAALVEEPMAAVIHAPVCEIPRILAPELAQPSPPTTVTTTTRADDLLATFAVSCGDEASMREATDGLKKLAGLEPTPPPLVVAPPAPEPTRVAPATTPQPPVAVAPKSARAIPAAVTPPAPRAQPALDALHRELEEEGQAPRKRARPGLSLFAALLAGAVVGLVAVTQLRPDLVTSFEERVGPTLGTDHAAPAAVPARVR